MTEFFIKLICKCAGFKINVSRKLICLSISDWYFPKTVHFLYQFDKKWPGQNMSAWIKTFHVLFSFICWILSAFHLFIDMPSTLYWYLYKVKKKIKRLNEQRIFSLTQSMSVLGTISRQWLHTVFNGLVLLQEGVSIAISLLPRI